MVFTFLQGFMRGMLIAIPVGPIGILCIRRTLASGQRVGLVSGLGAATADGVYGSIAGFGLTAVADFLTAQAFWLRVLGGLFLCYLGISTFLAKPVAEGPAAAPAELKPATAGEAEINGKLPNRLLTAYFSTLVLTLANPATIFSFIAIFAGLGIVESGQDYAKSSVLVAGVFGGSACWWLFLSTSVSLFRTWLTPARLRWLNRVAGTALFVFGIVTLGIRE